MAEERIIDFENKRKISSKGSNLAFGELLGFRKMDDEGPGSPQPTSLRSACVPSLSSVSM